VTLVLANLTELIADVRSLINESTASFWTDAEITRWLNEGQEIFSTQTKCLPSYYSKTLVADDIENDREIRTNSDFLALDEGGVFYNGKALSPVSLRVLDQWVGPQWKDKTGTPTHFYLRGDFIGFYPKPSAGAEVSYYGIERAPTLTGTVVPLASDYRVVALRRHVRDYAVAKCWEKKNEWGKRNALLGEFEQGMWNTLAIINGNQNDMVRLIPEYQPRGQGAYSIRYGRTDVWD